MRILTIHVENIHSLAGPHTLDFTSEPLSSAGLFAITGATGAGKSSLLDGLSLALYGKTARYSEGNAKVESVMTKHQGVSRAEVRFLVGGKMYRALWELKRARGRADGNLQQAGRWLYGPDEEVLAQKTTEADQLIQDITGLSYQQFTRSVLLAQGDFAKFLRSNSSERAELLESLTGTEIYSQISKAAHERYRETEQQRNRLQDQLSAMNLPSEEEIQELTEQQAEYHKQLEESKDQIQQLEELVSIHQSIQKSQGAMEESQRDLTQIQEHQAKAAPRLEKLAIHKKTEAFQGRLSSLDQLEQQIDQLTIKLQASAKELAHRESQFVSSLREYQNQIQRGIGYNQITLRDLEKKQVLLQEQIVKIDQELGSKALEYRVYKHQASLVQKLGSLDRLRASLTLEGINWLNQAQQIFGEFHLQGTDSSQGLEAFIQELNDPTSWRMSGTSTEVPSLMLTLTPKRFGTILDQVQQVLRENKQALDQASQDRSLAEDHLRVAREVGELRDYVHLLHPGDPCPLCGSLEHPIPLENQKESVKLEDLKSRLQIVQEQERKAAHRFSQSTQGFQNLEKALPRLEALLQEMNQIHQTFQESPDFQEWVQAQEPMSIQGLIQEIEALGSTISGLENQKSGAQEDRKNIESNLQTMSSQLEELHEELEALQIAQVMAQNRSQANQDSSPRTAQEPWDPRELKTARAHFQQQESALGKLQTTSIERKGNLEELQNHKKALEMELTNLCARSDFETVEQVRTARLDDQEVHRLTELEKDLYTRKTQAQTRYESAEKSLAQGRDELSVHTLGSVSLEEARERVISAKISRDQMSQELGRIDQVLESLGEHQKIYQETKARLDEIEQEYTLRTLVRDLIGSADGSKFRTYAQSLTLDLLLYQANRHLHRLNDRYRLTRVSTLGDGEVKVSPGSAQAQVKQALALAIEDHHQAGVTRPVESLSGGETFLVSLALALGLSDIAGKNRNIDSLFIDEGFGSLDPETLDIALSALESLSQQQKTVGIISHVEMLKERIRVQVEVQKLSGGHSRVVVKG